MGRFSSEESQRRDLVESLTLWVAAEFVGLLFLPSIVEGFDPSGVLRRTWFPWSLLYGIGGIFLLTASSQFMEAAGDREGARASKMLRALFARGLGWLGLAGVLYPLIMFVTTFFSLKFGK
jgi:hypothetical protein